LGADQISQAALAWIAKGKQPCRGNKTTTGYHPWIPVFIPGKILA
jgi:hypothetical protein